MNITHSFQISTFKRIEEHLNSQELEKAKQKVQILVENDIDNVHARTIQLWLNEIDCIRQNTRIDFIQKHMRIKQIIDALTQLSRMAIVILKYDVRSNKVTDDHKIHRHLLEYA